jgi:hypothetical protein
MPDKFFPIKTDTACQLKWNWSTLYLYKGRTASCHRTGWDQISLETFDTFHNTEKKQQERQLMLQGKWPVDSCGYCKNIEAAGGFSDRMLHLNIPNQSPPELETDPTAVVVSPTILEIFFNNTCNLACLYCIPELSSQISQENRKHGVFAQDGVVLDCEDTDPEYQQRLDKFWVWMRKNSHTLKRFNVLGGEPFYQRELDQCLDYFENVPHPGLELGIVTNLMLSPERLNKYINRFKLLLATKKLGRIDITASIDCAGPEQEFVRHGINLNTWYANFEWLLVHKWLTLNINQTICLLTIKSMPELLVKLSEWRKKHTVGHYFSVANPGPSYLIPSILGPEIFLHDFETIINCMSTETEQDKIAIQYMTGIANEVAKSTVNNVELKKLKTFLNEKDRRRGTNWKQTFPWLEKELEHVV